jgi:ElaB/YqjD/DUF883 family membrane-anchored ribosome-binding protein
MGEKLDRSADVLDFDMSQHLDDQHGNAVLEEKARQVGAALGKAVATLREARETLKDVGSEAHEVAAIRVNEAGARINEMAESVKNTTRQWSEAAKSGAGQLRQAAVEKARGVGSQLKTAYSLGRLRANQVAREYPLHLVLAAGAAGFLLGAGLRIWRSGRE